MVGATLIFSWVPGMRGVGGCGSGYRDLPSGMNLVARQLLESCWEKWVSSAISRNLQWIAASGARDGVALRFFDPRSQQWSIYAAEGVGGFDPHPMVGEFKDGRGEFYSLEPYKDRMLLCRVIWSEITATTFHWEQAFSTDGGSTWETNFISDFERRT